MIANHAQFIAALDEKRKVRVRFYSQPDSGVLDRVCVPLAYGPGSGNTDGLNRYWLWNEAGDTSTHNLGLVPQQIVDLQVLSEAFDPAELPAGQAPGPVSPPAVAEPTGLASNPKS